VYPFAFVSAVKYQFSELIIDSYLYSRNHFTKKNETRPPNPLERRGSKRLFAGRLTPVSSFMNQLTGSLGSIRKLF
jgi:hypothetical protein